MFYEIIEQDGKFKLFLARKNGLTFKKIFPEREWAESYALSYLRHCCLECLSRGLVYKTRLSGGLHAGGSRHGPRRGAPHWGRQQIGETVFCPECQSAHRIDYDEWRIFLTLQSDD